jgi:hypothetical protein
MNRAQLRTLVLSATGRSQDLALINSALDFAVQKVSAEHSWLDLLTEAEATLLQGQRSVDLAEDITRLNEDIRVIQTNFLDYTLPIRTRQWVLQHFPNWETRAPSRPQYGWLQGKKLFVLPEAVSNFTIRYSYYRIHPVFANDGSQTLIRSIDPAVVAYATHWVWQSMEKPQEAQRWLEVYFRHLADAKKVDKDNSAIQHRVSIRGEEPIIWDREDPFFGRVH